VQHARDVALDGRHRPVGRQRVVDGVDPLRDRVTGRVGRHEFRVAVVHDVNPFAPLDGRRWHVRQSGVGPLERRDV
jgi:hypothetical protein